MDVSSFFRHTSISLLCVIPRALPDRCWAAERWGSNRVSACCLGGRLPSGHWQSGTLTRIFWAWFMAVFHTCIYIYMYIYVHIYIYTWIYTYVCTDVHAYMHACIYIYIIISISISFYIHIYIILYPYLYQHLEYVYIINRYWASGSET
jgi:hypothetical protein